MNVSNIIPGFPKEWWQMCAIIGARDWLDYYADDDRGPTWTGFTITDRFREYPNLRNTLEKHGGSDGLFLVWMHALGQMTAGGVKLFRPTDEQCESMEQVEIRLPLTYYRQPYPTMVIEFPDAYRGKLAAEFPDRKIPRYLVTEHYPERPDRSPAFFSGCGIDYGTVAGQKVLASDITYFFQHRPAFPTIEHALRKHINQSLADSQISERFTRVAMNLCLLLGEYKFRLAPSNPKMLDRAVRGRGMTGAIGSINRLEASSHVHVLNFDQEVVVRRTLTPRTEPGPPTGRELPPHWRSGHWRMQRHGKGRSERKLVFIQPYFVRRDRFDGNLGDTSTTYYRK